jgi:hypothetical protein
LRKQLLSKEFRFRSQITHLTSFAQQTPKRTHPHSRHLIPGSKKKKKKRHRRKQAARGPPLGYPWFSCTGVERRGGANCNAVKVSFVICQVLSRIILNEKNMSTSLTAYITEIKFTPILKHSFTELQRLDLERF